LNGIYLDLKVTNNASFGPDFKYIIARALGSTPHWKEKIQEEWVTKQYHLFKTHNPDTQVNRSIRNT
jgi:hypothetical protein